jgi:hypothetical protein
MKTNRIIAKILYGEGIEYKISTSIAGTTTYGYGGLDDYGFWEYPLCETDIK